MEKDNEKGCGVCIDPIESPMIITTELIRETKEETVSRLKINGEDFGYILEDQHRDIKVMGDTRIPAGIYKLKLRLWGGHHQRYTVKFPDFHKGMIQVADVPNFEYILFHIGNNDKDTAGCLLNGERWIENKGRLMIQNSTTAYMKFYKAVIPELISGKDVYLHHRQ